MAGAERSPNKPVKRFRFSLLTLFWWQLLLAPLCLGALFARLGSVGSVAAFTGMIVAGVGYTAVLVWWSRDSLDRKRLPVVGAVYRGALHGALSGFLFWGVAFLPRAVEPLVRLANGDPRYAFARAQPWGAPLMTLGALGVYVLVVTFVVLHFSLLGGATGGVIGLARDVARRSRLARTLEQLNPQP